MRPTVKLWEIATIQAWWTPNRSRKDFYEWWKISWLKSWELNDSLSINENEEFITELWMENSSAKLFKKWTLLMAMYWATAWKLWILNIDATTNQAVCSIQNTKWLFDSLYVFHYLYFLRDKIIYDSFWWAQPNISKDYIKNIQIPLPPLETQKAIVAKLDQIFAELDQTKSEIQNNLNNTDELWKSTLNQAFQGDWEMKKLKEIVDFKITNINPEENTLYNYIWLENIEQDTWCLINFSQTNWSLIKSTKVEFKKWIVLYWKLRPYLNKVYVADFDGIATTEILPMNPKNTINPKYLAMYLRSDKFVNAANSSISWARMPRVTTKFLETYDNIPVPPLSEQEKIVEHLDQVSKEVKELKSKYQSQLDNLEELKKSVLDKAFKWELG